MHNITYHRKHEAQHNTTERNIPVNMLTYSRTSCRHVLSPPPSPPNIHIPIPSLHALSNTSSPPPTHTHTHTSPSLSPPPRYFPALRRAVAGKDPYAPPSKQLSFKPTASSFKSSLACSGDYCLLLKGVRARAKAANDAITYGAFLGTTAVGSTSS